MIDDLQNILDTKIIEFPVIIIGSGPAGITTN